jgi:hypothetical protein
MQSTSHSGQWGYKKQNVSFNRANNWDFSNCLSCVTWLFESDWSVNVWIFNYAFVPPQPNHLPSPAQKSGTDITSVTSKCCTGLNGKFSNFRPVKIWWSSSASNKQIERIYQNNMLIASQEHCTYTRLFSRKYLILFLWYDIFVKLQLGCHPVAAVQ